MRHIKLVDGEQGCRAEKNSINNSDSMISLIDFINDVRARNELMLRLSRDEEATVLVLSPC